MWLNVRKRCQTKVTLYLGSFHWHAVLERRERRNAEHWRVNSYHYPGSWYSEYWAKRRERSYRKHRNVGRPICGRCHEWYLNLYDKHLYWYCPGCLYSGTAEYRPYKHYSRGWPFPRTKSPFFGVYPRGRHNRGPIYWSKEELKKRYQRYSFWQPGAGPHSIRFLEAPQRPIFMEMDYAAAEMQLFRAMGCRGTT